ncbi:hypothetical protein AHAS_Ahas14G0098900 [Arachis hypogaea]
MLKGWFVCTGWGLLVVTRLSTISFSWVCTVEWSLSRISRRVLLPKGLIRSSWLHPSLIGLTLMHIPAVTSISFNKVRTRLKARGVRIHGSK